MVSPDMVPPDMVPPNSRFKFFGHINSKLPDMVTPDMVTPNSRFKIFGHIHKFKVRTLKEWLRNTLLASNIFYLPINIGQKRG